MNVGKRASAKVYIDDSVAAVDGSVSTAEPEQVAATSSPNATRKRVTMRLSHDISTEQLFSDQLIDGKVADGEDDEDDDEEEEEDGVANPEKERATPSDSSGARRAKDARHGDGHRPRRSSHRKSGSSHSGSRSKNSPALVAQREEPTDPAEQNKMYRIESHSHLSSLDARHLDKHSQSFKTSKPSNRVALAPLADANASAAPATTVCTTCLDNKDMPPLHCAAYSGHAGCLALLLDDAASKSEQDAAQEEASAGADSQSSRARPYHLDKKRRTPLFYSCAANRIDCCALLLARRAEWRDLADKQFDTPVHVCCFFGWHACLQRLLDAGADPHGRNAKGFKPSHIAKTRECLELLLSYGDDLQQGDKLGRTPLFVACARDRSICVEFLCSWNHQTRSWMLEQEDQRGDRPIHAAACNGSNASLEILLRYGADPSIQNAKDMSPRDLALANNHPRCVELLTMAEQDLANANAWFAPANAVGGDGAVGSNSSSNSNNNNGGAASEGGWIECWDNNSAQPFYYNNLSGKCQWEVPEGFAPHLLELLQSKELQQQQQQHDDDENGEYVWVKKKRQTVCVATGKESEWTAVQDPASKAIYYKNTRTGQSQWEEPDAVQQLQSASAAQAAQQATKVWDELESSRAALARALAADKQRQLAAQQAALEASRLEIQRRRDDIRKKEEQAKLQQLLPRSSFIRRKKQSMMIKIKGSGTAAHEDEDKMELICQREPSLDIFLSTYLRVHGVRDLQLSIEKRFFNCLFHYYAALVDPVQLTGLGKSHFRTVLRDAAVLPSSFAAHTAHGNSGNAAPTLKLHVVDLIFAQAARVEALEAPPSAASAMAPGGGSFRMGHASPLVHSPQHRQRVAAAVAPPRESRLGVVGFVAAMQIVRERVAALAEAPSDGNQPPPSEIDDDEEWFLATYALPLAVRLGGRLLTQIRECKELDLAVAAAPRAQARLAQNRLAVQRLHRFYTAQEPTRPPKMLTFRGLSQFALDFGVAAPLATLHQWHAAVNWISGHAHTEVISFEKFQQLLVVLAVHAAANERPVEGAERENVLVDALDAFFRALEASAAIHRVAAATQAAASGEDATAAAPFFMLPVSGGQFQE